MIRICGKLIIMWDMDKQNKLTFESLKSSDTGTKEPSDGDNEHVDNDNDFYIEDNDFYEG